MLGKLAFIIFGWSKRTKNLGQAYPRYCNHCQNETMFSLIKARRWLSIFFIPIFPISKAEYHLSCDICRVGTEIERENATEFESLIEDTQRFRDGKISGPEYERRVRAVEADVWDFEYEVSVDDVLEAKEHDTKGFE